MAYPTNSLMTIARQRPQPVYRPQVRRPQPVFQPKNGLGQLGMIPPPNDVRSPFQPPMGYRPYEPPAPQQGFLPQEPPAQFGGFRPQEPGAPMLPPGNTGIVPPQMGGWWGPGPRPHLSLQQYRAGQRLPFNPAWPDYGGGG